MRRTETRHLSSRRAEPAPVAGSRQPAANTAADHALDHFRMFCRVYRPPVPEHVVEKDRSMHTTSERQLVALGCQLEVWDVDLGPDGELSPEHQERLVSDCADSFANMAVTSAVVGMMSDQLDIRVNESSDNIVKNWRNLTCPVVVFSVRCAKQPAQLDVDEVPPPPEGGNTKGIPLAEHVIARLVIREGMCNIPPAKDAASNDPDQRMVAEMWRVVLTFATCFSFLAGDALDEAILSVRHYTKRRQNLRPLSTKRSEGILPSIATQRRVRDRVVAQAEGPLPASMRDFGEIKDDYEGYFDADDGRDSEDDADDGPGARRPLKRRRMEERRFGQARGKSNTGLMPSINKMQRTRNRPAAEVPDGRCGPKYGISMDQYDSPELVRGRQRWRGR